MLEAGCNLYFLKTLEHKTTHHRRYFFENHHHKRPMTASSCFEHKTGQRSKRLHGEKLLLNYEQMDLSYLHSRYLYAKHFDGLYSLKKIIINLKSYEIDGACSTKMSSSRCRILWHCRCSVPWHVNWRLLEVLMESCICIVVASRIDRRMKHDSSNPPGWRRMLMKYHLKIQSFYVRCRCKW